MRRTHLLLIPAAFAAAFGLSRLFRGGTGGHGPEGGAVPLATRLPEPAPAAVETSTRLAGELARADSPARSEESSAGGERRSTPAGSPGPEGARAPDRISLAVASAESLRKAGELPQAAQGLVRQLEAMAAANASTAEMRPVSEALEGVNKELVFNPSGTWRSEKVVVEKGDSWHRIAKRFAAARGVHHGIGLLRAVNRRSGDLLVPGERLRIPTDAVRVVVHRASFAAFTYLGDVIVRVYPVGIGREDAETPTGKFVIGEKVANPVWWKPKPPIPAGDPRNPLGARWLGFRADGQDLAYGIHGTEREDAVGTRVSEGCIRLHNRDVVELYDLIPDSGTTVEIF
ncbi:MAG TPA: L,D-transpeptidase family protein [Planctomycetota bacterium]|nr:L,D-transpeptidase family protein [Planctomycetota bacterium]